MGAVVADTHALLWLLFEPSRLSRAAAAAFQDALSASDPVHVSTISVVEARYLVDKGRLLPDLLDQLCRELERDNSGIVPVSLDLEISQALQGVPRAEVPDMPDRIIAATALHLGLPLITADARIRSSRVTTIW